MILFLTLFSYYFLTNSTSIPISGLGLKVGLIIAWLFIAIAIYCHNYYFNDGRIKPLFLSNKCFARSADKFANIITIAVLQCPPHCCNA